MRYRGASGKKINATNMLINVRGILFLANLRISRKPLKSDLTERCPPVAGDAKAGEPKAKPANELVPVERANFYR